MKDSVAVIILHFNSTDTHECLKTLREYEPSVNNIVVDNASTDGSTELLQQQFSDITYLIQESNRGFAAGNNAGIRYAKAQGYDYVLLLNNDTVIQQPFIAQLTQVFEDTYDCGAVSPTIYCWPDKRKLWAAGGLFNSLWARPENRTNTSLVKKPYVVDFVSGCALLTSMEVLDDVGLLDEDFFLYHEDVEWCLRAQDKGYGCVVDPFLSLFHKASQTTGGSDSPLGLYHNLYSNLLLIKKRHKFWQRLLPYSYILFLSVYISLKYSRDHERLSSIIRAWKDYIWQ